MFFCPLEKSYSKLYMFVYLKTTKNNCQKFPKKPNPTQAKRKVLDFLLAFLKTSGIS